MADAKPGLTRDGTMQVTAKEGKQLLGKHSIDEDAGTRGQQKKIDELTGPAAKKAKGAKAPGLKKTSTMQKTTEEAKLIIGDKVDLSSGRQTRAQARGDPPKKPSLKKEGTMQKTAKEGKAFLKGKKGAKGKKEKDEEKTDDAVNDKEEKKDE